MKNVFQIFKGSYQIDRIESALPIKPHYAEYRLAKELEYQAEHQTAPGNDFWASITDLNGTEYRYQIIDGEFKETLRITWGLRPPLKQTS